LTTTGNGKHNRHQQFPRRRRAARRLDVLSGLVVMLGIALLGATWSIAASRATERQLTQARVAQAEQATGAAPLLSVGQLDGADLQPAPDATPPARTSNVEPLLAPTAPWPTPAASGTTAIATPELAPLQPLPTPLAGAPWPPQPPPTHISIPAVGIDAAVVQVSAAPISVEDRTVLKWQVADYAAGHHDTSASPGDGGNIVIAGHDDYHGDVFRGLHDIRIGDRVTLTTAAGQFIYVVQEIHLRLEKGQPLDKRLAIGVWMQPMPEERLTLITCWPYGVDDHRMIVVAKPLANGVSIGDAP
jgi:sortase A